MKDIITERIGEENYNKYGTLMRLITYNHASSVLIEFQDKYKAIIHTSYQCFKNGTVTNPYDKVVYGKGYMGQGKYSSRENNKKTDCYNTWYKMIERCYDEKYHKKYSTYIDCEVCEEWLCFQNFAKWYEEYYYEIEGQRMHLDKDILVKGNKIYSPDTCIFVPLRINELFTKSNAIRGEYPIGIYYCKQTNKLKVQCNIYDNKLCKEKRIGLGCFSLNKPFQAFTTYKNFKENYIKQVADEYKELIPLKLYKAMYEYQVEIND